MSSLTNIPASGGTSTQTPAFGSLSDLLGPLATGAATAFNQPYQTYDPNQRFAPFTADQNTAFGQIRGIATNPATGQGFTNAQGLVQSGTTPSGAVTTAGNMLAAPVGYTGVNTTNWSPQAMTAYMDPNLNSEVASTLNSFDTNADRQTAQERANLAGEQAFGEGGDQALGNFTGQIDSARGALQSSLESNAYNTALGAFQNDATRNLTASTANQNAGLAAAGLTGTNASRLGSLGLGTSGLDLTGSTDLASILGLGNQVALGNANALQSSGATQQTLPQNQANFNYQQWLQGIQYPWTQANNLTGIISGTPHGSSTTTTPSTSAAQAIGLGIAGLGALPSAVSGTNSLINLLGGGSSTASGTASDITNTNWDSILGNPDTAGSFFGAARGGRIKGAFDGFAKGGRVRFDDGGPIQPDAGNVPDPQPDPQAEQMASADQSPDQGAPQVSNSAPSDPSSGPGILERLTSLIGGGSESDPHAKGTGLTGAVAGLLDNPLVALGASIAATPGGNTGLALGQGLLGAMTLGPKLKQEAATLRNTELQGNMLDVQGQQKNLLLNFQKGGNGMTQTSDGGMLLDPRRLMQAIQLYTAVGDGRSAAVYKGLLDMASKGNFDPATGQVRVGKDVLVSEAQRHNADNGAAPSLDTTPPVSTAPNAPAALAAAPIAVANGTVPAKVAVVNAKAAVTPVTRHDTDANGNDVETVVPASTLHQAPAPLIGPQSRFAVAPVAPAVPSAPIAPPAPPKVTTAPLVGPGSAFNPQQAAPGPVAGPAPAPQDGAAPAAPAPPSIVPTQQDLAPGKWVNPDLPSLPAAQAGKVTLNAADQQDKEKAPEVLQKYGQQGTEAATAVTMANRALELTKTLKTGIGTDLVSDVNRVLTYGGFPPISSAVPASDVQELNKIASQMMLATLKGMPGGRPLYSEGQSASKATVDPTLEFGANRAILSSAIAEGSQRMGLAAAAPAYARDNGGRMRGFEQVYAQRHPYSATYEQTHNAIMAMAPPGGKPAAPSQSGTREGATATNPNTGAKVIFRGGAWQPVGTNTVLPALGQ